MEIRVKSLKFDADQKLLDYVEKKVSKLSRFSDHLDDVEVTLSLLKEPDNKNVRIQSRAYGQDLVIERNSTSFEDAVSAADRFDEAGLAKGITRQGDGHGCSGGRCPRDHHTQSVPAVQASLNALKHIP